MHRTVGDDSDLKIVRHALYVQSQMFGVVHVANPAEVGVFFYVEFVNVRLDIEQGRAVEDIQPADVNHIAFNPLDSYHAQPDGVGTRGRAAGKNAHLQIVSPGSLKLAGQIIGDDTKAQAAIDFIVSAQQDLDSRTRDIADADKPTVFVGGLGSQGLHGIESTQAKYALLDVIHAKNVVDETGESGGIMIDKEKLLEWNPAFIFIDQGGYALVVEDYQNLIWAHFILVAEWLIFLNCT